MVNENDVHVVAHELDCIVDLSQLFRVRPLLHGSTLLTVTDDKKRRDQPSGGETTWTNTGATRYGRRQNKTGSFVDDMLRLSPNHGTQWLTNNENDDLHKLFRMVDLCDITNVGA